MARVVLVTIHSYPNIVIQRCTVVQTRSHNQGSQPRRLQMCSYFEWLLGAAPDWHREFHRIFIETSYDAEHGALLATKVLWDLPGEQGPHWNRAWPYVAFHSASVRPTGYDGDKRAFLGRHGRLAAPQSLHDG